MSAAISSSHCSGNFRTAPRVHGVVYSRQHALATLGGSRCSRLPSRVTGAQKLPRWTAKRQARENFASSRTAALPDTPSIQDLNKTYGIPGSVSITEGHNGLPMVLLTHECGSSAAVYLYGACVASWKQISDDEVLFMRPDAVFDKTKPISGGIPHCFPQFGPGVMQQHGFARNLDWTVSSTSADLQPDEKDPEVELVLSDNEYTRSMWDHSFKLVYSVSLHGEELRTAYRVINTDDKPFEFTAALHSYFEVAGIQNATVRGLKGLTYLDKVVDAANPPSKEHTSESLSFSGPTDSVFLEAPEYLELDVGTGAAIAMSSTGWTDAVVWNPWEVMPSCYESFCCVENAAVSNPIKLAPGESWAAQTDFKVIDL